MTKFVVVKKGTKSLGMARDYVVFTKKHAYTLESIANHTQKTEFTYSFLLELVIEIHKACGEMYYWEETEDNFYLINESSYSVWKEKKDRINKAYSSSTKSNKTSSKRSRSYPSYKSAYKEWLLDQGLCPKYGCLSYAC